MNYNFLHHAKSSPITIALASVALAAFACEPLAELFQIDLQQPEQIGILEILGCHLLHWSKEHLFWDLAMFCWMGAICEVVSRRRYIAVLLASALIIPLAVAIFHPTMVSYRGLSGIDTGLFTFVALTAILNSVATRQRLQAVFFAALLLLLFGKIAFEFATGNVLFLSQTNFTPLPIAHLVGAIVGLSLGICGVLFDYAPTAVDSGAETGQPSDHWSWNCDWL